MLVGLGIGKPACPENKCFGIRRSTRLPTANFSMARGVTGSRRYLKSSCRKACRFESGRANQQLNTPMWWSGQSRLPVKQSPQRATKVRILASVPILADGLVALAYMPSSPEQKSVYMRERYTSQRRFFLALLGGKCKKCGSKTRLEFDHIDPTTKTIDIGQLFSKVTIFGALKELIGKCQILCKPCHVEKTATESVLRNRKPIAHGTMYAWMKVKCNCPVCHTAKWAWHDRRNQTRRAGKPYQRSRPSPNEVPVPDDAITRPSRRGRGETRDTRLS